MAWCLRGLFAVLLVGLLSGSVVTEAYAVVSSTTSDDSCDARGLLTATVAAQLRIDHEDRTYAKASATMTLTVPMSWKPAAHLLLSTGSDRYRRAMRCLARGDHDGVETRWEEWRAKDPAVTPATAPSGQESSRKRWLEVRLSAHAWVAQRGTVRVGPWTVEVSKARWDVRLAPPESLNQARWHEVTVDPGRPGARSAAPRATTKEDGGALVWRPTRAHGAPSVEVRIEPAWPRSFSALDDSPPYAVYSAVGGPLWPIAVVVAVWCALIVLPRHGVPDPVESKAVSNLRNWSLTLLGVALTVQGRDVYLAAVGAFENTPDWARSAAYAPYAWLTSAVAGALLLRFARPPRAVALLGAVLGVGAAVPVLLPGVVGLDPERFVQPSGPGYLTVGVVWGAAVCSFALPLLGGALAVRRVAVDGGLWRPRHQRPRTWLLMAGVGAVVAIIGICYAATAERDWNRASWLSPRLDPTGGYGAWHQAELRSSLLWFTETSQWWWFGMWWVLSGLAILAVLRSRAVRAARATTLARRGPKAVDRLLLLLLFPVMAAMDIGVYTGSEVVAWSWFFLNFFALAGILRLTGRRVVPARPLSVSGEPLATTLSATHRARLLDRARRYRELHAGLRGAASGQTDEGAAARRDMETRLRRLHRWRASTGSPDRLPRDVSVVDAALALGPCDTWWENGVRAARFTQPVALAFSGVLVWDKQLRGDALTNTLYDRLGLPDVVTQFVLWQVGYAAAGFLLGALWQELPGRRGPAKALALAAAYAMPIGLFALGNWSLGEEQTALAFAAASMLLILTLTGVRMDLETFRSELLPGRGSLSLLPVVYQTRYLSIQFAWVLAQAAAIATIAQFFADNGGPPWAFPGVSP
ncbi:hypothetical protein GCM10012286_61790 [Streptomyces lasiicapitis]|uniref:Uncharacterized protein n=1 Tax=Streptomyces lasiicapitis TaxID=1923961 RepID=A0ABQ2MP66_9ACTN|nr:hypothetical protein GCM10012286_61790 [Streptomyces lasiicapitis]